MLYHFSKKNERPWPEKYRPNTLKDIVGQHNITHTRILLKKLKNPFNKNQFLIYFYMDLQERVKPLLF